MSKRQVLAVRRAGGAVRVRYIRVAGRTVRRCFTESTNQRRGGWFRLHEVYDVRVGPKASVRLSTGYSYGVHKGSVMPTSVASWLAADVVGIMGEAERRYSLVGRQRAAETVPDLTTVSDVMDRLARVNPVP